MAASKACGLIEELASHFRSLRPGKTEWDADAVGQCAKHVLKALPHAVIDAVKNNTLHGPDIIKLKSKVKQRDLRGNAIWLKAVLQVYNAKVASVYFIADMFMVLDAELNDNLLKPVGNQSKQKLALKEAGKLKRMISYLRYLWRSTHTSHCPVVHELKQLLMKKPKKQHKAKHEEEEEHLQPLEFPDEVNEFISMFGDADDFLPLADIGDRKNQK